MSKAAAAFNVWILKNPSSATASVRKGDKANITEKSLLPNSKNIRAIPSTKAKSLILLTIIALSADLFACIRVYQKLIKRKEHKPTPSQPKKSKTRLSPVTRTNIKKVNRER